MKTTLISALFIAITSVANSQEESKRKHVKYAVQLNGVYSSFQDVKYSNIVYNGAGAGLEFIRSSDRGSDRFEYGILFNYAKSSPSTFSMSEKLEGTGLENTGIATELRPTIYVRYTRKLNEHFSVGGRVDLLDGVLRTSSGLGNNSFYYFGGHNLSASGRYDLQLSTKLRLNVKVDLGLVSYIQESTSFAFSSPHSVLSEGLFNYQTSGINTPLGYRFYEFRPFWKYGNIHISTELNYQKRWSFSYAWNLKRFSTVKGYPTTVGLHTIGVRFNFINKIKSRKKH